MLWPAMVWTLAANASDFGTRHPVGSIRDRAQAQAALKAADAELQRIRQNAISREAECYRKFLVNSCRDDVRREMELAEREVRRVEVEARGLQRRLDADDLARRRAADAEQRAVEDKQRAQNSEAARAASEKREAEMMQRSGASAKRFRGDPESASEPVRQRPAQDGPTAEERAENARRFEQKQAQAEKRAQQKEAERKKNEQRRAEKRKQMEQREAEREAVRQKAAQALK